MKFGVGDGSDGDGDGDGDSDGDSDSDSDSDSGLGTKPLKLWVNFKKWKLVYMILNGVISSIS